MDLETIKTISKEKLKKKNMKSVVLVHGILANIGKVCVRKCECGSFCYVVSWIGCKGEKIWVNENY